MAKDARGEVAELTNDMALFLLNNADVIRANCDERVVRLLAEVTTLLSAACRLLTPDDVECGCAVCRRGYDWLKAQSMASGLSAPLSAAAHDEALRRVDSIAKLAIATLILNPPLTTKKEGNHVH